MLLIILMYALTCASHVLIDGEDHE